jgi:hypothetical protein
MRETCLPLPTPIDEGFLLNRFDLGLSIVEAEDPETREGVRVFAATSNLGRRDEAGCGIDLGIDIPG